jgi:hypothetical protein
MSGRVWGAPAVLLVSLLLLVPAVAGCGSDKKSSGSDAQASWADGLCSSVVTWRDSLKSAGAKVKEGQLSEATLASAASAISEATTKLGDDLRALGKPPTPVSKEARATATQLADDLNNNADHIKTAVAGVSSATEALAAAPAIGVALSAMKDDVSSAADNLRNLEKEDSTWKQAFEGSGACQNLANR